jgi:hypothetical protein
MKTIKLTSVIIISLLIFSSCKTGGGLVVGSWKCTKLKQSSATAGNAETNAKSNSKPSEIVEDNSKGGNSNASADSFEKRFEELQSAYPEIMSAFVLQSNGNATISYSKKALNGKWKLDEKTNTITVKDAMTGKKLSFNFSKVDAQTLMITKDISSDSFFFWYKKQ